MAPVTKQVKKAVATKFTINVSKPVADGIFDLTAYEKFLHDRIKVDQKTNNLQDSVHITKKESVLTIQIAPSIQFAKRYIKYLTKKFLKKHQLRDWLRVVSSSKYGYEVRYFNIAGDNEEEDDD